MKNFRIICYWPSEVWAVLERIEKDDHTTDWMAAYHCSDKGKDGYNEAKNWLKENDK